MGVCFTAAAAYSKWRSSQVELQQTQLELEKLKEKNREEGTELTEKES